MRFFHLSDLHLGKRFNEAPLTEDQRHVLDQVLALAETERPDAVLIAGDVYDRPAPPVEAVALWDSFLSRLMDHCPHVFVLPGNHDSAERVSQYAEFTGRAGLHLAPAWSGSMKPVTLRDEWGEVDVWQLPFIRPSSVRPYTDAPVETFTDAAVTALSACQRVPGRRNVLCAHQYVTGAERSDSDIAPVGGLDNVDASAFDGFDYVALGHIHREQNVTPDGRIRYCGAPLKYTFGECDQAKSLTVADLDGMGRVSLRLLPLRPLRETRRLRGAFADLLAGEPSGDYLQLILTDENEVRDAMKRLQTVYPNALALSYDNSRTRQRTQEAVEAAEDMKPAELFDVFFRRMANRAPTEEEQDYMNRLIAEIWEEDAR